MLAARTAALLLGLSLVAPAAARAQPKPPAAPPLDRTVPALHDYAKWEKEIAAFEAADRERMPAPGGIVFTGSSTIRLWKTLAQDYKGLHVINRGFGGSEIADATHFAERIIFPYTPKTIVLRAGGNDIHNGRRPSEVVGDFANFVAKVRTHLPKAEIIFIGTNATPARWGENDKVRAMNDAVRAMAIEMPFVTYVDAYDVALTPDGKGRPELFVADRLHFNPDGYKLLAERLRPYLPPSKAPGAPSNP
jgi:lysophospholipase L1-like esterase